MSRRRYKTPDIPVEFRQWLGDHGCTVVPLAAAELLKVEVPVAERLVVAEETLRQLIAEESETPMGDLLRYREHEAVYLRDVAASAAAVIAALQQGQKAEDEIRDWRQAVFRYDRRKTA